MMVAAVKIVGNESPKMLLGIDKINWAYCSLKCTVDNLPNTGELHFCTCTNLW